MSRADCDHIVVGAGGGTLAARMAEAGRRVVLLEAGSDPRAANDPGLPDDYDVPAFHPFASENPAFRWDFFVRHYADAAKQARDPNFRGERGVLYPRASGLGGCTAHNAMIFLAAPDADWDAIATLTGDPGWSRAAMHRHFRTVENRHYRRNGGCRGCSAFGRTGHRLVRLVAHRTRAAGRGAHRRPAASRAAGGSARGAGRRWPPTGDAVAAVRGSGRSERPAAGTRRVRGAVLHATHHQRAPPHRRQERVLDVAARYPDRLRIETDALATRLLLAPDGTVNGLEYCKGARLYRAHADSRGSPGETRVLQARGDIILAGCTFNTPQLLMLSGIGDPQALATLAIRPVVNLPGVGRNLQDRYEVSVVNRMAQPWSVLAGARFAFNDRLYQDWTREAGCTTSSGAPLAVARRSGAGAKLPDLVCMALLRPSGSSPWLRAQDRGQPQPSLLDRPEGAYGQPCRPRCAALCRSTRAAGHPFQLVRRRWRRRRSRCGRPRHSLRPADDRTSD